MKSGLFDEEVVKKEAKRHNEFLNSAIGLLTFTLGLTCLGFDHPQRAALVCLGVIIPVFIQAWGYFPETIKTLRELVKETNDPHAVRVLKYLEKKYIGIRSLVTKNILYWYGLGFYLVVLLEPEYLSWVKT